MAGTLHVVGVGPGDPELLTLKAARMLRTAPVVAFFAKRGRPGHARGIAAATSPPGDGGLRFEYPFTTEIAVDDPRYAAGDGRFLRGRRRPSPPAWMPGQDVALLCEGDPFFYGSAMYLFDRLRARYRTRWCRASPA